MSAGDDGHGAQVALPEPAGARRPHAAPARLRRHAVELRVAVVHVEHLVAQDLLEDRTRLRVIRHTVAIDLEAAGGGLLRDVEKREEPRIGLVLDAQIVEPVAARQRCAVEECVRRLRARSKQRLAALPEQIAVMQLVDRVLEIQAAQQRIGRDLGRAQDVPAAVGLDFAEQQQLANATIGIAPHPAVDRSEHPIPRRRAIGRRT